MASIYYKNIKYGGSGSGTAYGGTTVPTSSLGDNGDYYYQYDESGDVKIIYVKLDDAWHKIDGGDIIGGDECFINDLNKLNVAMDITEAEGIGLIGTKITEE